jgi:hypothetical protein
MRPKQKNKGSQKIRNNLKKQRQQKSWESKNRMDFGKPQENQELKKDSGAFRSPWEQVVGSI